ncbi:hypothetical protein PoB_003609700 [Plakobranchus ocellatus]|uniref:Uncharacterized protein n=1 Tax=Plakobranchus ocellatus TaxID=259542 RepID=A0AAV4AQK0_9GAST|nr:hypothetical protein PoB_003609700 [Plakobranchus ocellatus]
MSLPIKKRTLTIENPSLQICVPSPPHILLPKEKARRGQKTFMKDPSTKRVVPEASPERERRLFRTSPSLKPGDLRELRNRRALVALAKVILFLLSMCQHPPL